MGHVFNIATNLTMGPFVIGYEEDPTNFFLRGEIHHDKPRLSGRLFDSRGQFLAGIVNNRPTSDSAQRVSFERLPNGLVLIDHQGRRVLTVVTVTEGSHLVTYVQGEFFDNKGRLAARGDERGLLINCPLKL